MKLHRIQALLLKYYYVSTSGISRSFDMLYWPAFGLIVFGLTALFVEQQGADIRIFLIGGLMIWVLFERLQQDVDIFLLEDFWSGNVANEYATPVTTQERFVALFITALIRSIISLLLMALIAYVLYSFSFFNVPALGLLFGLPLFLTAWGLAAFVGGIVLQFGIRIQMIAWAVAALMQPIAAAFYPVEVLPAWLQKVAYMTPLAHTFEGYRAALDGVFMVDKLLIGVGLSIVFLTVGYWFFQYSEKKGKENSMIASN